jgi:cardiolipin synthase (CMP-forming)
MLTDLPNLLTLSRIVAIPLLVALVALRAPTADLAACVLFSSAAITDYFDGRLARTRRQQSDLGRMLDPIADKLLVASCLLMLAADTTIRGWTVWAAIVILCREILVSGLREYLAELRVSVPVTQLAKWKTAAQLLAIGFLLAGQAGDQVIGQTLGRSTRIITELGIGLLWISALVTLYTGWDYFRAGIRHLIDE